MSLRCSRCGRRRRLRSKGGVFRPEAQHRLLRVRLLLFPQKRRPRFRVHEDECKCQRMSFRPKQGRSSKSRLRCAMQLIPNFTTSTYPYVSHTLPRNMPGVPADSKGRPIIMSRRHERNVASEHGYIRAED